MDGVALFIKAISDGDDCVEGMRKFTTEVFDTGVALLGYAVMLFIYDWRLAFLSLIFTPISYFCAARMKKHVQRTTRFEFCLMHKTESAKKQGILSDPLYFLPF